MKQKTHCAPSFSVRCVALALSLVFTALPSAGFAQAGGALRYPAAQKGDQVDVYFGTRVADPYRWLEDTDSPATKAWVDAENSLTFDCLSRIPQRPAIRARVESLFNYEKFTVPQKKGGRYFFTQNTGLQNQAVLYVQDGLRGAPRVLLDPNVLSADGTVALSTREPSPDGRYLGYGVAIAGSDWQEFRVRDVSSVRDLPDT